LASQGWFRKKRREEMELRGGAVPGGSVVEI